MTLINQAIKTLMNGVSRQPANVRLPGQVQEAINTLFTVETGGFEKRGGAALIRHLTSYANPGPYGAHFIDRDASERYVVIHSADGQVRPFSLVDGNERSIGIEGSQSLPYLQGDPKDFSWVTVADYTIILNRKKTVKMNPTVLSTGGIPAAVLTVLQSFGHMSVKVDGNLVADYAVVSSDPVGTTAANIATAMAASLGAAWNVGTVDNFIFVQRVDLGDFTIDTESSGYLKLVKDVVSSTSDLPAKAPGGMLVKIATTKDGGGYYLVFKPTNGAQGIWTEAIKPGIPRYFDGATMPQVMIRQADGTFLIQPADWAARSVGDLDTCPDPGFVGQMISDMAFFRDRLVFLAGESVYYSQVGKYFTFWPDSVTQVIDSDPFSNTAATNGVSLLRYAAPFRQTLFLTADRAQFECTTPSTLTPTNTSISLSTAYEIEPAARPLGLGDSLFMASTIGSYSAILEYVYDYQSLQNTATDISKHVHGYIPSTVLQMAGDAVANILCVLPEGSPRNTVYAYSYFWQGMKKEQAAWGRWTFDVDTIWSIRVLGSRLYLVASKAADLFVLSMDLTRSPSTVYPIKVCLDFATNVTGVYNADTNETALTVTYDVGLSPYAAVIPSKAFGARGFPLAVTRPGYPKTVFVQGNWSTAPMCVGLAYETSVELSKQYIREQDGSSILDGRCQLRQLRLSYQDAGYFQVGVTPEGRDERVFEFTGRQIGAPDDLADNPPIRSGTYTVQIAGRADTTKIIIRNSSQFPFTIVSASWTGLFSSIGRQG